MKKNLLLTVLMLICIGMFSQTILVTDKESGNPVYAVSFISEIPKAFASTNAEGLADISGFKGSEKIEIYSFSHVNCIKTYQELEADSFQLYLESSNLNIDEVVISATRWTQVSGNTPTKIISVSPEEINLQNPQTSADLLGISGKVYIQKSQQGGGSPMIRGFATNRLLYSVDGVRMNTAIFRSGNIQNVISLDPFAAEHTEILFGPGSVIYGSDAIGGVMSFQTLSPQLSVTHKQLITGKSIVRYSSANNEKTMHFDIRGGWKKWAFVTSISAFDFGHLKQGSNGPDDYLKPYYVQRQDTTDIVISQDDPLLQIPTAYTQINMMQKLRFKPNTKWDIQYGFHFSKTSSFGRYDRHNRMREGLPRYAEWFYGPQKWMMNLLSIEHTSFNSIYDQFTFRLAYQNFEESRISRSLNSFERILQNEFVDALSFNLDFIKKTGKRNTLYYGAEYVHNNVVSEGILTNISTGISELSASRYPQAVWQSAGIYVNDLFKLSDKFFIQSGARYTHFLLDANFDTSFYPLPFTEANLTNGALTGSLGAIYRPSGNWAFSMNLASAFRSPNVDDIGKIFDSEPGAVVIANPDLKAEYAYSIDFGVAKVINHTLKVDFTAYYTILENALVRRNYTLNGLDSIQYEGELSQVQAVQNAAQADVYGFQAGINLKLPYGFSLSSDINFQKGEEEQDDGTISPSRHAAPLFGNTKLHFKTSKLHLELYANYQAEKSHEDLPISEQNKTEIYALDNNGNTYSPGWYTLNFKGLYSLTEYWTITAGIENLTDQRYRPYSSGLSGPGRNFFLSLILDF